MSFRYNSTGIDPDAKFPLLPEHEWFPFNIYEAEELVSKEKKFPMILAKCEPMDARFADMDVWHYIVFIPRGQKGDGINVHFRRCIGVPFGGDDEVHAEDWVGKRFMGKIGHEPFNGRMNHKIVEVSPMRKGEEPGVVAAALDAQRPAPKSAPTVVKNHSDETIPF